MLGLKRIWRLLCHTGTIRIFIGYLLVLCAGGVLLRFIEPDIHTAFDGIWYCFVASTTIGFGDIVATTFLGRFVTICVTLIGILTVAMVPGVVVAYYTEYLKAKENETISTFLEKLENLPALSQEELTELSERVKEFERKRGKTKR